ncbi:hypothetical protein DFJ74DRAFT_697507 [Hyaloraphidium curvatum]|nr:hypothetical protein DFJ74DRAFT_697507 [Hyaloraphidium curvatum]
MSSWFGSSSSLATAFSIAFTEPAANATFKPGDNIVLRWKNTNLPTENPPTAKIDIYESAWGTDPVVTNVDPAADLSYEALGYTVPTEGVTFKKGAKYYFHMTAGTVKAASNNFFIEPLGAPPSVTVTSPQLPQTAIPNFTKIPVTWVAKDMPAGAVAKVEIFGAAWGTDSVAATVVEATDAAAGTADWVPATDLAAGTYYAVVTVTDSAGTEIAKHTGQQFELTLEGSFGGTWFARLLRQVTRGLSISSQGGRSGCQRRSQRSRRGRARRRAHQDGSFLRLAGTRADSRPGTAARCRVGRRRRPCSPCSGPCTRRSHETRADPGSGAEPCGGAGARPGGV